MAFDPISAVLNIIDKVIPDRAQAQKVKDALNNKREDNDVKLLLAQIGVNAVEAASGSKFIAGWRPALAWVCLADVVFETIAAPLFGITSAGAISTTMPILVTLIGARSYDKGRTVDTKGIA